jgi:hypothetical protein
MKKTLSLIFCLLQIAFLSAQNNFLTIYEKANVTTVNYPMQIARPFIKSEIQNFPQAIVNGIPVSTQADVKQWYSDGSVEHAIISFFIPQLAANDSVLVSFQNQNTGNNNGALSQQQMLVTTVIIMWE